MRAFVIGNVTLDESFSLAALPRPGETLLADGAGSDLGGKGANQAVLLARAGIATTLIARIGTDAAGTALRAALAEEPVTAGLIATEAPTDRSVILVAAGGENCIVSTAACARAVTEADVRAALAAAAPGDLLLMQGNLTPAVTEAALRAAGARGLRRVFNPAPVAPGFAALWPLCDLVVLNQTEAAALTGLAEAAEAARHVVAAGAGRAVVTLGAAGAVLAGAAGLVTVAAEPVHAIDTTGAGDTFTALLAAGLFAHAMTEGQALRAACRAAAITVRRAGTLAAFPTEAELHLVLAA